MADNFNLRSFLTENKLTKNTQLLKELDLADVPEAIDLPGVTGQVTVVFYSEHGMSEPEIEVMSVEEALALIRDDAAGDETEDVIINTSDIDQQGDFHPETKGLTCVLEVAILNHGTYEVYEGANNQGGGEESLNEGMYYVTINIPSRKMDIGSRQEASSEEEAVEKAKKYIEQDSPGVEYIIKSVSLRKEAQPSTMDLSKVDTNSIEIDGVDPSDRPDFADAYISYAEYEDGTPLTDGELDELTSEMPDLVNQLANDSLYEKAQNKKPMMKETKLTAKERRLVEMVNNAMGMQEEGQYEGHQNADPNVPNDSTDMAIDMMKNGLPEGDDMVEEKPMPKYESIDQLMKEIEHGTNEAAHKYRMEEMKRIYELLETKVTSLEEGENAEHIDQSKVKQMRKDIAALRKAEEKLRKEFEKKFNKKEKPAAAPKAEKEAATEAASEALQEGTFDLRKFLAENRK